MGVLKIGKRSETFVDFSYTAIGTAAMKAFLEYLIKHRKGLIKKQRTDLLSKVEKSCIMKYVKDGTKRNRLLKGIEKVGSPDPQRYFRHYRKRNKYRGVQNGKYK